MHTDFGTVLRVIELDKHEKCCIQKQFVKYMLVWLKSYAFKGIYAGKMEQRDGILKEEAFHLVS